MAKLNPAIAGDTLINPFIHLKPGVCPDCAGQMIILSKERAAFAISPDGEPTSYKSLGCMYLAYCNRCKGWFNVSKEGMNFRIIKDLEMKESFDRCLGQNQYEENTPVEFEPLFGHYGEIKKE